jgi:hypothetical protein
MSSASIDTTGLSAVSVALARTSTVGIDASGWAAVPLLFCACGAEANSPEPATHIATRILA